MADEIEIKPGQVWRRKKSGKFIIIERERIGEFGHRFDDWVWRGYDYTGHGVSYGSYIRRGCELVQQPSGEGAS